VWEGSRHVLENSELYCYLCHHQKKMFNFLPDVVIWWTLKIYFWEIMNTLSELFGWYKLLTAL